MPGKIVAVLKDLIFTVKIEAAARHAGVPVEFVKTAQDALQGAEGAAAVILDLNFVPVDLIVRIKSAEATRSIPLIGYVSHVHADLIRQAKDAGCDTVMARSAFVLKLSDLLESFAR